MPSNDSLTQQAEEWKTRGNEAFQKGAIDEAHGAYSQGIVICDRVVPTPGALKATLLSNRALCSLRQGDLDACVDDCTKALEMDPTDAKLRSKILFRRSKGRFMLASIESEKSADLLQDSAKDLLVLLKIDPKNAEANQLLSTIRALHKSRETAITPVSKTVDLLRKQEGDLLHNLKSMIGFLENDLANTSMELGRLNSIPVFLSIAEANKSSRAGTLAVQVLSHSGSHPPFVRTYLKSFQADLCSLAEKVEVSEQFIPILGCFLRIILHADRDDPKRDIIGDTALDYASITKTCVLALNNGDGDTSVIRAVLDVLTTWTCGIDLEANIRASLHDVVDPTLPRPVTENETNAMTPHQFADHRKRQSDKKKRDLAWAYDRSMLFCSSRSDGIIKTFLRTACVCEDHVVRREMTVVLGRILVALDDDEEGENIKIKDVVRPLLADSNADSKSMPKIEEVYNDDGEEKLAPDSEEDVVPLEAKMERALITSALLWSRGKQVGSWALTSGWTAAGDELPDLINSDNSRAMCVASEVLAGAAGVETTRPLVANLISAGSMEKLMRSEDRHIRSGAASAVGKLGLGSKHNDEGERMELLQAASSLLEDDAEDENKPNPVDDTRLQHFGSFSTSTVERAIEMFTYLSAHTEMKDEIADGFASRPGAPHSALELLVKNAGLPKAGESLPGFGLASIFHNLAVTNEQLRREAFEGKEYTVDQYDEMQKLGKSQEEKDAMEKEKDTDTQEACGDRIRRMSTANVPRALVSLTEGASEHTLEQIVLAMVRMAAEVSVRGVLIQQGVLSACIKIEKNEEPTETDLMKKIVRIARHCIAKILITTNPSLLTSAQRLGSVRPLLELIRDIKASDLMRFECLLAVTNIASSGEDAQGRIVSERGIPALHFAMFSDHEMVQQAAAEAMSNLIPHERMMDHLRDPNNLKLWLAFAADFEDRYETARAAAGCLAMATQDESIAKVFVELERFRQNTSALLESGRPEIMHRGLVIVHNLVALGGQLREKAKLEGLVAFCNAYAASYHSGDATSQLEFTEQDRTILPLVLDLAKKIVRLSES